MRKTHFATIHTMTTRRAVLATLVLVLVLFSGAEHSAKRATTESDRAGNSMQLRGREALKYLKQQGVYDLLTAKAALPGVGRASEAVSVNSTISQVKQITASDGAADDEFGYAVAVDGDTLVVGAYQNDVGANNDQGAVYVFSRHQGGANNWGEVKQLTASDGAANNLFGNAVSVDGDTIVVGAYLHNAGGNPDRGAAYVFSRNQGGANNWGEVKKLIASDGTTSDFFGWAVALDGDTLAVAAVGAGVGANGDQGAAYVFSRNQGGANNWGEVIKLTVPDGAVGDRFGVTVALDGDTIVAGADRDDVGANGNQGSAYVFSRNQGGANNWGQVKQLTAADGAANDFFGYTVAVDGDTIVVGAYQDDVGVTANQGAAYVFSRNQGGANNWGEVKKLIASDGTAGDEFGVAVAVDGDTIMVGAWLNNVGATVDQGAAYVFSRNQGGANNWGQIKKLIAAAGVANSRYGWGLAVDGDTLVVGAYGDDLGANADQGAVYLYSGLDCDFTQQAQPVASDGAANDNFGRSVAVDGDTLVVGVWADDNAKGSAYVFSRNQNGAGLWGQVIKLTASDGATSDQFGISVAVDGDTIVVGAHLHTVGANGQGAAYVYSRNQGGANNWGQVKQLSAADGMAFDRFGYAVAVDGDTIVSGAWGDGNADQGAAYVFSRNQGGANNWGEVKKLTASDGAANDFFGLSVALDGDVLVAGASSADVGMNSSQGAAYVYSRNQGGANNWGEVKKLTAQDGASSDNFGQSVTVDGDTLVVGVPDGNVGANNNQGSAYVFSRNQGGANNWGEVKKLTASDGAAFDKFGWAVAADGDTIVIGVANDGVGANERQGSAYVYSRNQGGANNWGQSKQLFVADGQPLDTFGNAVSVDGDTIVVGAWWDDVGANTNQGSAYVYSAVSCPSPTLGTYANANVGLSGQTTVTPSAAPGNTTSLVALASSGFNGTLRVNPATGVVSVVNAHPAGTHTITVNAFGATGMTTASFQLTVQTGTACFGTPAFMSAANVTGVSTPLGTAVGDFNNDGKQDLVTANGSNATASIRLGDGAGGFTGTTTVSTPTNPNAVAVGDFNGDGNQDIAVSSSNNAVAIRLGDGAGGFTGTTNITTGQTTKSIALGDFNNDGKLDFVTADIGGDSATVALGNGAGGFPTVSAVSVGDGPGQVVVADFNNDGKLDFATSNQIFNSPTFGSPGTVTVRIGHGDGTFTNGPSYNVGDNPEYLAVGDFNEDGKPDLITSNQNSSSLSLILGDVSNTVTPPIPTTIATSSGPGEIRVADLNRDGHQDVVFKRSGLENFAYLLGTGMGSFGTTVIVPVTSAAGTKLAVGDFNGDGYQDFVTANFGANTLFVRLGGCDPAPTITAGAPLTRQQGSTGTSNTIATVTDNSGNGSVTVMTMAVPPGIFVTNIVNSNGMVTATVRADCSAAPGNNTVVLKATDSAGGTAMANLTVNVTANSAPSVSYGNVSVNAGASTSNSPTLATDNGSISGYAIQSQGGYTGTISVNSSGVVSVSNAAPVGAHTVTIRATDNCGSTTDATFTLDVANSAPTITAAAALTRQRGSAGLVSTIAMVSDVETPVGSLVVTVTTVPAGITVTSMTSVAGTVTANVAADCTATIGLNIVVLTVMDGNGGTATASLWINVTDNSAPTLSYAAASVVAAGSITVNAVTATDNGSITGYSIVSVTPPLNVTPTVNGSGAVVITNASPAGSHLITVRATDNCGATTEASFTLTVTCSTITVTPPATSTVTAGVAFNQSFTQTGGAAPVSFALASGTLPSGLTLAANGTLSGTTSQTGSFPITVSVTDANGCTGTSATFTLTVTCQTLTVSPASLNSATTGVNFSQSFSATGNLGTLNWSLSGTTPPGLNFNAQTASLSGAPTQSGSFTFTIRATDANGCFGERPYTLGVGCASVTVNPANASLPGGTAGMPYSQSFTAAGGTTPYNFTLSAGNLPTGLSLNTNGTLSGAPTSFGTFNFTIKATDANGCFGERQYSLRICGVIALTASLPAGTTGTPYTQTITASGSAQPYTFALSSGNLPTGLNLNSNGTLSGTPMQSGSFTFAVTATDALGCTGAQSYTVSIACQTVTITQTSLPNGFQGTAYSQTFTASGGTAPYSFAVTSGSLPGGLSLASGGALTGTPTASGTFSFTVTATDGTGCTGTRAYTVIVSGNGLMFYPLAAPVRLLDTRTGATACTQPNAPVAGQTSLTQVGRNFCGIPANAVALTGNISTINSGGGFLTLYPSDAAQPTVANSTYGVNEVINNVFTVGLGAADGAFKIFAFNTTDVAVDVTGYYAPPATGGLYFHPLPAPVRLLDTRTGATGCVTPGAALPGNADATQQAITPCTGIPAAARALVGNATTISPQGFGYLTLFPGDAPRPLAASSTYGPGQTVNGPFTVGLAANGEFKIYTFAATDLAVDVVGYYSTEANDVNGAGLLFTPLPKPVRLLETRNLPTGCFKPNAPLNGQQEYTQVAQGTCDGVTIPTNARGIVGNATAVTPNGFGFLTLWPSGATRPLVATATYSPGEVTNRHFIVGLGAGDGAFKMYTFATSHLVIDLAGYFAP